MRPASGCSNKGPLRSFHHAAEWRHLRSYGRHSLRRRSSEFSYEYVRQANSMEPRCAGCQQAQGRNGLVGALGCRLHAWEGAGCPRGRGSGTVVCWGEAGTLTARSNCWAPPPVASCWMPPPSPRTRPITTAVFMVYSIFMVCNMFHQRINTRGRHMTPPLNPPVAGPAWRRCSSRSAAYCPPTSGAPPPARSRRRRTG